MGSMKDHFFGDTPYPAAPGFKNPTTSKAAAKRIEPRAGTLRAECLEMFRRYPTSGLTADEVAKAIDKTEFAIRPRVTELHVTGWIVDSQQTRPNRSGVQAIVWRIAP